MFASRSVGPVSLVTNPHDPMILSELAESQSILMSLVEQAGPRSNQNQPTMLKLKMQHNSYLGSISTSVTFQKLGV